MGPPGESLTFYTILFTKFNQSILKQARMEYGREKKIQENNMKANIIFTLLTAFGLIDHNGKSMQF